MNVDIKAQLHELKQKDMSTRQSLLDEGRLYAEYAGKMQKVHRENAICLNKIIEAFGWPGKSLVGLEGSQDAWLIAQHSICTPELQIKFSKEIEKAFKTGEVPKKQMILLQDQVLFRQNRPQICGWVFDWQKDGQMGCFVQSVEQANALREELGMPTYEEALEQNRAAVAKEGGKMPGTYEEYRSRADAWRESVGWK